MSEETYTGHVPWDGMIDCSMYKKTQVEIRTVVYEICSRSNCNRRVI